MKKENKKLRQEVKLKPYSKSVCKYAMLILQ